MRPVFCVLLVMAAATGCVRAPEVRYPNPMVLASADAATTEKVARRILVDMRFEIIQPSSQPGVVVTRPLTGDSWFEFWRDDTVGQAQRLESSLHTVRRVVTVTVTPWDQGAEVAIKVVKDRVSAPDAAPDNIARSLDIYNASYSELMRQDELVTTDYKWVALGRDEELEQLLLERIQVALASGEQP